MLYIFIVDFKPRNLHPGYLVRQKSMNGIFQRILVLSEAPNLNGVHVSFHQKHVSNSVGFRPSTPTEGNLDPLFLRSKGIKFVSYSEFQGLVSFGVCFFS